MCRHVRSGLIINILGWLRMLLRLYYIHSMTVSQEQPLYSREGYMSSVFNYLRITILIWYTLETFIDPIEMFLWMGSSDAGIGKIWWIWYLILTLSKLYSETKLAVYFLFILSTSEYCISLGVEACRKMKYLRNTGTSIQPLRPCTIQDSRSVLHQIRLVN